MNFNGSNWVKNGPSVITRVLNKICSTKDIRVMTRDSCHGFDVLPSRMCFAVSYWHWRKLFNVKATREVLEMVKESVIVHFWNYLSIRGRVRVGNGSAYDVLAKQYCPLTYAAIGKEF